jgi:hypothetical protein
MKSKRRVVGYVVIEVCEDWEQLLCLRVREGEPPGGILDWGGTAYLFSSRAEASAAIYRTHHYRHAFNISAAMLPEKCNCKIKAVEAEVVQSTGGQA